MLSPTLGLHCDRSRSCQALEDASIYQREVKSEEAGLHLERQQEVRSSCSAMHVACGRRSVRGGEEAACPQPTSIRKERVFIWWDGNVPSQVSKIGQRGDSERDVWHLNLWNWEVRWVQQSQAAMHSIPLGVSKCLKWFGTNNPECWMQDTMAVNAWRGTPAKSVPKERLSWGPPINTKTNIWAN